MAKYRNRLILTPLALLLSAAFATPASALGLGNIEVKSRIGEPLMATVTLSMQPEEIVGAQCFKIVPPANTDQDIPWLPRARLALDGKQLVIRGVNAVHDPIVAVAIRAGCNYDITREYALLLQPPEATPVIVRNSGEDGDAQTEAKTSPAPAPRRSARAGAARRAAVAADTASASAAQTEAKTSPAPAPEKRQKPANNAEAGGSDRIVVHGGANPSRARTANLDAREKALVEREQRLIASLDDQVAAQLELADKMARMERVLSDMQERAQRMDAEIAARQAMLNELLGKEQRALQEAAQTRTTWGMWALAGTPAIALLGVLAWRNRRRSTDRDMPYSAPMTPAWNDGLDDEPVKPARPAGKKRSPQPAPEAPAAAAPSWEMDAESTVRMQAPATAAAPIQSEDLDYIPPAAMRAAAAPKPAPYSATADDTVSMQPAAAGSFASPVRTEAAEAGYDWAASTSVIDGPPRPHEVLDLDFDAPPHDRPDVEFVIDSATSDVSGLSLDISLDGDPRDAANDENDSVLELAEIMLSFGRTKGAAQVLAEFVHKNPKRDVRPWIKLLEVYQRASMQQEYEELAPLLRRTYNVHIPSWFEYLLEVDDASIEEYPHIMRNLSACWGTAEADTYLRRLLAENRGGSRRGFPLAVVADILLLIDILHIELTEPGETEGMSLAA
ncbi:MAG: hypothetical protein KF778_19030 [Rhodocyclaceae bacterium]|nr:hypothetical protein [Rhodocyclaceae bacterium]MBX3670501.1 hypothetical protein [Rhodocyclaceae bacterium]